MFADGANQVARAVHGETGLRTVFHHHCAGYVETPEEIARLLELTDPKLSAWCSTPGTTLTGRGTATWSAALERFRERVWYIHFKDCQPEVARQARAEQWDYFEALRHGVFCELGKGCVDFPGGAALAESAAATTGYTLVEQDVLPGMGTPKESARRNREYLRSIESQLTR